MRSTEDGSLHNEDKDQFNEMSRGDSPTKIIFNEH